MSNKRVIFIGGGTFFDVRSHFSLAAPAFGGTVRSLFDKSKTFTNLDCVLATTKMAGGIHHIIDPKNKFNVGDDLNLRTNADVQEYVDTLVEDDRTRIVFFNVAMCDWEMKIGDVESGKGAKRLSTHETLLEDISITPSNKVVRSIRQKRKDITLVAFKQTHGATEDEQYIAGLNLCKEASCNLVVANDTKTRLNMIITPEEARYCVTKDRNKVLTEVCDMAMKRSHLTFTRSTVIEGNPISWDDDRVPAPLRAVVDFCIKENAYKPFRGSTAGHFAVKMDDTTFLTSIRKTDFNQLRENGLVMIKTDGPDTVLAYGAKPSVGGQSQRIVFNDHSGYDCILHFHCPIKENPLNTIPVASQKEFECGSHECGQNTSSNLRQFGNLKCVYLDNHGPNIIFNRNIDPNEVIEFIQNNFDLDQKTGGFVSIKERLDANSTVDEAMSIL